MDFLDPKKRRAHLIRLYIGYGLMAILVGMIAILMLFQAYGYSFNVQTGDITQNGLMFVDAHPLPANLTLNGVNKGQTDQRLILPEGTYSINLSRDGYRDWNHDVALAGGKIERFVYPFLFPNEIETENVQLYATKPDFATQSPDRQWLLVQVPGSFLQFDVYNLSAQLPVRARITLPRSIITSTGSSHSFKLVEWSTDNDHLVVEHSFDGGKEFLLLRHTAIEQSQNLSKSIPVQFTSLRLRDKNFNSYYLYNKSLQTLQRYELGAESVTTVQTNVLAFQPHGDDELLFVTDENAKPGEVIVKMVDNGNTYSLKTLPAGKKYLIDVARFDGKWYMAVGSSAEEKVYILRDPVAFVSSTPPKKVIPVSTLRLKDAQYLSFSQNTRFVALAGWRQIYCL